MPKSALFKDQESKNPLCLPLDLQGIFLFVLPFGQTLLEIILREGVNQYLQFNNISFPKHIYIRYFYEVNLRVHAIAIRETNIYPKNL